MAIKGFYVRGTVHNYQDENIAPEFQPYTKYVANDLVMYNGLLYQCRTSHQAGAAFVRSRWQQISISEYLLNNYIKVIESTHEDDNTVGKRPIAYNFNNIDSGNYFSETLENNVTIRYNIQKDVYGRITKITNTSDGLETTINWNDNSTWITEVNNLGQNYSSESTYSKGDYAIYNDILYQAIDDIDTPEAWNSEHWTRAYLAEDLTSTAESLSENLTSTAESLSENLTSHTGNTNNPHSVTKTQVGLITTQGTIIFNSEWTRTDNVYTQTVTVSGITITNKSKVDLQPSSEQLIAMMATGVVGLVIENNNGTLIAHALKAAPPSDISTMQCTVQEVDL